MNIDNVTQTRTEPNESVVKANIEKIKNGEKLEPIIVSSNGKIVDGNHRYEALKQTGAKEIDVLTKKTPKKRIIGEKKSKTIKEQVKKSEELLKRQIGDTFNVVEPVHDLWASKGNYIYIEPKKEKAGFSKWLERMNFVDKVQEAGNNVYKATLKK